jgi:hypothetical protein
MKEFAYLYPIPEYTDFICPPESPRRQQYAEVLNRAIDLRYRQQGFGINYVVFDRHPISDIVKIQPADRIIEVGIDFKTHTTKQPNGEYPYPNPDNILNQLTALRILRVGGFHLWDCVDKLARRAYEKGVNVLVDEDLTEILPLRLTDEDFAVNRYPSYNPRAGELGKGWFELFMQARKNKPWLWQDY